MNLGAVGFLLVLSKILINRHKNLQLELVKKEFEAKQFEREAEKKLKDEVRKVRLIMSEQTRTLKTQNNYSFKFFLIYLVDSCFCKIELMQKLHK